jgi:phosphotransferase system HPr (HPr) family protein
MKKKIKISNKLGLHARASSKLVQLTNQFQCDIKIGKAELIVDAKSILGLLSLAASYNTEIDIETIGPDEESAINEIINLFNSKFGEEDE